MLTMLPTSAFAAGYDAPTLSIEASYDSASSKVTAKVILGACSDLGALDFHMKYDLDKLAVESIVGNEEFGSEDYTTISDNTATTKDIGLTFVKSSGMTVTGTKLVFTATFSVKPGQTGDAQFAFDDYYTNFSHKNGEDTASTPAAGSVTTTTVTIPKAAISSVTIADLDEPRKGATPDASVTVTPAGLTADVKWFNGETEVAGNFAASTAYTVKIKLTASGGDNFADTVTAGDYTATRNSETELLLTKTFDPTPDKTLTKLEITGKNIATGKHHGDTIDQSELTVTATYDDGNTDTNFKDYTIVYNSGADTALKKGDNSITVEVGSVKSAALAVTGVLGQDLTAADFDFKTPNEVTYNPAASAGVSNLHSLTWSAVNRKGDDTTTRDFIHNYVTFEVTDADGTATTTPTKVGNYTIKFWWKAGPTHEARDKANALTFTGKILSKDISGATINFGTQATYDGNSHTANYTVTDGTYTLVKDTDYTVRTNTDTATDVQSMYLYIDGIGNYKDATSGVWTLVAKDVTLNWENTTSRTWHDGKTVTATVSNKVGSDEVIVTVNGGDATDVGGPYTATATGLTGTKAGNYKLPSPNPTITYFIGKATATGTFEANFEVLFSDTAAKTVAVNDFTGLPTNIANARFKGTATGLVDSNTIIDSFANESFKLKSGLAATNKDDTASWKVTIESENYDDIIATVNVKVIDKTIDTTTMTVMQAGCIYGDTLSDYVLSGKPTGAGTDTVLYTGTLRSGSPYSSSTVPTEAGTYQVKVECETSDTIYKATSANFTIAPKSIRGMTVTLDKTSLEYNGSARTVNVTVKDGTTTLIKDTHYTVTGVTSSTNVGNYTVTVTGTGNYTDSVDRTWEITQGTPTYTVPTGLTAKYGQTLADVNIAATTGWSWMNTGTAVGTPATKNFPAKFTPADAINYKTVENIDVPVTVGKADVQVLADISVSQKYTVTTGEKTIGAVMPADAGPLTYTKGTATPTPKVTSWDVDTTGKVTYTLSGGAAGDTVTLPVIIKSTNYADSTVKVKINLTAKEDQAALTLTGGTTVVYGQTLQLGTSGGSTNGAVTYTVTPGTGNATVDNATGKLTPTQAGDVTVTAKMAGNTAYNDVTSASKTITINKATVTVAAKNQSIYVGGTVPSLTSPVKDTHYTVTGLVGSDALVGTLAMKYKKAGADATPTAATTGTYDIVISGVSEPNTTNYNSIVLTNGTLTISNPSYYGGGGGGSSTPSYSITADKTENGTITVSPKSASKGDTVTITVKPDKGYELEMLKALDKDGDALKLTEKNGKYTFKMPSGKVTVKGSFVEETPVQIFKDVPVDAYYYEAVKWAAEKGITGGVGNGLFAPNQPCTRAQIVTFLWRAAGSPAPKHMSSFADVPADAFYAKAVAWAVENGITGGTGDGKFSPDATCTRAQSVTFLYRAAGSPKVSGSAEFGDVATNAYYADAVAWAAKNGITGGIGGGLFGSGNDCTRAQIVTFLYRSVK